MKEINLNKRLLNIKKLPRFMQSINRKLTNFLLMMLAGFSLVYFLCLGSLAYADSHLNASLDRNPVNLGDTFQFILTYQGDLPNNATVNFSALQKNFQVIGVAEGNDYQNINGKASNYYRWTVTLSPKAIGTFVIPSFTLGNEASNALQITVHPSLTTFPAGQKPPVFIQASISQTNSYVQSPILYTLRIFYNINITNVDIVPPSSAGLNLTPFGQDDAYESLQNGKPYKVFQRTYLLTPAQAGTIEILPAILQGQILDTNTSGNFYDFLNNAATRAFRLSANPIFINVRAIPKDYKGWWLPAEKLSLIEQWSNTKKAWPLGQPVTRTIILQAEGVKAEQLPILNFAPIPGMNIYPGKPILKTEVKAHKLVASSTMHIVYIPTQAGNVDIPGLVVTWWNIKENKLEVTSLAANVIASLGSVSNLTTTSILKPKSNLKEANISTNQLLTSKVTKNSISAKNTAFSNFDEKMSFISNNMINFLNPKWMKQDPWFWTSAILFTMFLISMMIMVRKLKFISLKINKIQKDPTVEYLEQFELLSENSIESGVSKLQSVDERQFPVTTLKKARYALELACRANQAVMTKDAFLNWLELKYPDLKGMLLDELKEKTLSSEFKRVLENLERTVYADHKEAEWLGMVFWQAFIEFGESSFANKRK